jgi:hypothetical protein
MRSVSRKLVVLLLAASSFAQAQHHHDESKPSKPAELLEGFGTITTHLLNLPWPEVFDQLALNHDKPRVYCASVGAD